MPNNPKRNHHVLPKLYLKGFVIPDDAPHIWIYTRDRSYKPGRGRLTDNPYRDSINQAMVVRDYYADGKDFETYENVLESLEKPANVIIKKIRACQPISETEKEVFTNYIVQMHRRVPRYREEMGKYIPGVMKEYEESEELLGRITRPGIKDPKAHLKQILDKIANDKDLSLHTHLQNIATTPRSQLIPVIRSMNWHFFVAPKNHAYLTGDDPMFIHKSLGLNKPNSELSFPISSLVTLVASWRLDVAGGYIQANANVVKELNRRTASQAIMHLCSSENESWIVGLLNKKQHKLNLIWK